MKISVIIPTYKRKSQTLETIKSFKNQTLQKFEMIIVDQGPELISSQDIASMNLTFSLKHLCLDEANLPKARNVGIRNATSDILLFCDDDIVPDRFLVEKHLDNYKDASIGGVGGRIVDLSNRKRRKSIKVFYPFVAGFNPLDASLIDNFHLDKRCEVKHVNGCNMSFRRDLLITAGLFDECLGGASYLEDTDMSFKIRRLGYRLLFEPKAMVKHLGLTYGGCQLDDFNDFIYWLYFTDILFFLRYFRKIFLLFFSMRMSVRLLTYVFSRRDTKIIGHARQGFLDAVKKYAEERKASIGR